MRTALLAMLLSVACAPQRPVPEAAPESTWRDYESRDEVRLKVVDSLMDQGNIAGAQAILADIRSEGTSTPELDYLQGRSLYLQNMYAEAEELLTLAAGKMRKDPRPYATLGLLYADSQRVDEAVQALRLSLDIDEAQAETWNNLGFVLHASGSHDDAVDALREAIRLDGTIARYRNNLGFALHASGRPADALQAFQTTGTPADAHTNMAIAWEVQGDDARARDEYMMALSSNPVHRPAKEGLGRLDATSAGDIP